MRMTIITFIFFLSQTLVAESIAESSSIRVELNIFSEGVSVSKPTVITHSGEPVTISMLSDENGNGFEVNVLPVLNSDDTITTKLKINKLTSNESELLIKSVITSKSMEKAILKHSSGEAPSEKIVISYVAKQL